MADIELVIKINEDDVHRIVSGFTNEDDIILFANLLNNGTPLPKRLVDADKFINSLKGIERLHINDELRNNILKAVYTNIIEADKAEGEE